tara:strand:- start:1326 stop:2324 length:999 start_codon:yes stop_codon:yes gene_type:complete
MALQVLIPAGVSAAAKALMKTPAGQKIAAKGGKAVRDFLGKKGLYSKGTGKKSVKHRNEKIAADKKKAEAAPYSKEYKPPSYNAKTPAAKGNRTAPNKPKEMDARNILKKREKYETNMTKEQRAAAVKKARGEAVRNARGQRANRFGYEGLKAGGEVKKKARRTFVDKFREDTPLGIGKILTPIESSGIGGAYKRMTKGLGEKIVSKYNKISNKKTTTKEPVKKNAGGMIKAYKKGGEIVKPAVGRIKNSKLERNILAGRPPLDEQDLKQIAERTKKSNKKTRQRMNRDYGEKTTNTLIGKPNKKSAGGLIKKKSIDGIAMRGNTKVKRVKG